MSMYCIYIIYEFDPKHTQKLVCLSCYRGRNVTPGTRQSSQEEGRTSVGATRCTRELPLDCFHFVHRPDACKPLRTVSGPGKYNKLSYEYFSMKYEAKSYAEHKAEEIKFKKKNV